MAFASRYHWVKVGDAQNLAAGDQHIARVCSYLGLGDLAVKYAASGLEITEAQGWRDYRLAAAYEAMARAHASAGDTGQRDRYLALASEALERIDDPDDRTVIEDQLQTVPGYAP